MISVVVPVYNEGETVVELHRRIVQTMELQPDLYEIIFINDGSTDQTYERMKNLRPLKAISLQRNYGETPALDVGIQEAQGEIIVFLDADLQDDPKEILKLLAKLEEGYDVAVSWRQNRQDHWSRIVFSRVANIIVDFIFDVKIHDFGCGLKVYRSSFIKDFRLWGDSQVFLPAVAKEKGAKICEVPVSHQSRPVGNSKIRISKMIKGGFDIIGVKFFITYFSKPLRFFGSFGVVSLGLAAIAFIAAVTLRLSHIVNLTETPLPIIGTLFTITGIQLIMMGLIAEILLRMYYASVRRSPYVIAEIKKNE